MLSDCMLIIWKVWFKHTLGICSYKLLVVYFVSILELKSYACCCCSYVCHYYNLYCHQSDDNVHVYFVYGFVTRWHVAFYLNVCSTC